MKDIKLIMQTMNGHTAPITALDFDEPYGMLVTAGQDDVVKVWDLCDGELIGQLRGHSGMSSTSNPIYHFQSNICC